MTASGDALPPADRAPADRAPADRAAVDVVAVGSALVDVLAPATDEDLDRLGLVKGSMELVDRRRSAELYAAMASADEVSGGSAANTAAGIAALGGSAGFVCKVADDDLGKLFVEDLSATGVLLGAHARAGTAAPAGTETPAGTATPDTPGTPAGTGEHPGSAGGSPSESGELSTGHCLVFITSDSERTMATHLGVASTLRPEDIDEDLVSQAQVVYLEGYLWDLEPAKAALRRAVEVAHGGDGMVALTVSDPFCVQRHRLEFLELVRSEVDIVFANEEEAMALFGAGSLDEAVEAVAETGVLAAITRGAGGSVVVSAGGGRAVPAVSVREVVDTTGAGDLYAAGFLYGLTHGLDPEDCARLGSVCAGEIVTHVGARPRHDLRQLAGEAGLAI